MTDAGPVVFLFEEGDRDLLVPCASPSEAAGALDARRSASRAFRQAVRGRGVEYPDDEVRYAAFTIDGRRLDVVVDAGGARLLLTDQDDDEALQGRLDAYASRHGYESPVVDRRDFADRVRRDLRPEPTTRAGRVLRRVAERIAGPRPRL